MSAAECSRTLVDLEARALNIATEDSLDGWSGGKGAAPVQLMGYGHLDVFTLDVDITRMEENGKAQCIAV